MIQFSSKEVEEAAKELDITIEDLRYCTSHPSLEECQRRLEALKSKAKKAYRKKALELHPDRTGNDPKKTERFKYISKIWEAIQQMKIGRRPAPQPIMGVQVTVSRAGDSSTTANTTTAGWATAWGGWKYWTGT